jgi:predicted HTH domain antitoxin
MNNSSAEKLSKVVSAKVTPEDYKLAKRIAAKLYENGKIGRNSVSELVRILVESLLSECRKKQEHLERNYNKIDYINTQSNLEYNQKNQQFYDIISRMPEIPTLPQNTKTKP